MRAFVAREGIHDLASIASQLCWWQRTRAELVPFCHKLGAAVTAGAYLADVLLALTKASMHLDDEATLVSLQRRVAHLNDLRPDSQAILEVEETVEAPR